MTNSLVIGAASWTASGPSSEPKRKAPPRTKAPGAFEVVLAPARHMASSLKLAQPGQAVEAGAQSATHSARLPTMSKAPRDETQPLRPPVSVTDPLPPSFTSAVLQSVVPLSGPGSWVPLAATCHSAFVGRRLPELAHASCAW